MVNVDITIDFDYLLGLYLSGCMIQLTSILALQGIIELNTI